MLIKQGDRLINSRNWTELVKPEKITRDESSNSMHGRFVCEPLERGFGTTIGNALRRVLLSSLQGAAFVSVKITGVQHEFSSIHGVLEDVGAQAHGDPFGPGAQRLRGARRTQRHGDRLGAPDGGHHLAVDEIYDSASFG